MKKTDAFKETITQQLTDAVTGCSKRLKDNLCILNDKAVRNARFALNPTSVVISDNLTGKEFDVKEIYKRDDEMKINDLGRRLLKDEKVKTMYVNHVPEGAEQIELVTTKTKLK